MAKSVEEIYEEARKWIGVETGSASGRYPVEYEPIRRYCHMVDDTNPLFLDPEYAKSTRYGGVICPPLLAWEFGHPGPWPVEKDVVAGTRLPPVPTPGNIAVFLSTEWEFLKPVRIGDMISSKSKIIDVNIKPTRLDPKTFWLVSEEVLSNQDGEVVAVHHGTYIKYRTPEQIKEAGE